MGFPKGKEPELAEAAIAASGPVHAWEHENIPRIVNAILGNETTCPQKWPDSQFDLVWLLDRRTTGQGWDFAQVSQMLLSGDSAEPVPFSQK